MTPTLVLLPGLHGTAGLFASFQQHIPADIRYCVVSYPRDKALGYRRLVTLLEEQFAAETDIVLLAESFSGVVALEFAARNPTRVKGVVLCGSFVRQPVPRVLCYVGAAMALVRFPIPRWAARLFLGGRGSSKPLLKQVIREVRSVQSHVIASRVLMASWCDGREALRRCAAPVLCIAGRRDRLLGRRSWRRIQAARSEVQLRLIEGPHLLLQIKAAEVWREVREFIETIPAQRTSPSARS